MHECMRRECVDRHVSIRHLQKQIDQYEIDLKDAWDENDRLAAIVERLPKTADGVIVFHGDKVWSPHHLDHWDYNHVTFNAFGDDGATSISRCYTTREAAKAAAKGGK